MTVHSSGTTLGLTNVTLVQTDTAWSIDASQTLEQLLWLGIVPYPGDEPEAPRLVLDSVVIAVDWPSLAAWQALACSSMPDFTFEVGVIPPRIYTDLRHSCPFASPPPPPQQAHEALMPEMRSRAQQGAPHMLPPPLITSHAPRSSHHMLPPSPHHITRSSESHALCMTMYMMQVTRSGITVTRYTGRRLVAADVRLLPLAIDSAGVARALPEPPGGGAPPCVARRAAVSTDVVSVLANMDTDVGVTYVLVTQDLQARRAATCGWRPAAKAPTHDGMHACSVLGAVSMPRGAQGTESQTDLHCTFGGSSGVHMRAELAAHRCGRLLRPAGVEWSGEGATDAVASVFACAQMQFDHIRTLAVTQRLVVAGAAGRHALSVHVACHASPRWHAIVRAPQRGTGWQWRGGHA